MGLFLQNMKPYIFRNGSKNILNCNMGCNLSSPWAQQNKWIPMGSNDRPQMQCVKPRTKRWKRLNLFHNTKEKTSKGKNMGVQGELTTKLMCLALPRTSNMPNVNQKTCQRCYWKKNYCVIFLKQSFEVDLFAFLQVVPTRKNMLLQPREKAPKTTSSAPRRGVNLNYLPQWAPIRTNMNPTRIQKQ